MKNWIITVFCLLPFISIAQPPAGYYDAAEGLSGNALKNALFNIISNGFTSISYSNLWTAYATTDKKPNGKVWDMYSDIPGGTPPYEYSFVTNQCGNYQNEGDCYNREHSVPKSWFGDASPMYSDLFHVVPTDGKVNGQRSNYPYGQVGTATWTSQNGSKLGPSGFPGYNGVVFEPIDSFKGDFARIYFYMCVRYKDKISSWTGESFNNGDLSTWTENLFLQWHILDPVSSKEIERNNNVYSLQHNRNPFIDNPDWVFYIWGPTADLNENLQQYINVYPNPANENINISYAMLERPEQIILYDIRGRTHAMEASHDKIDVSAIPSGYYFLKFVFKNSIAEKQIVIIH
jgi:endonuclease I